MLAENNMNIRPNRAFLGVTVDKIRIAFIGAGGIAQNYLGSLDDIDQASVTAICDLDEKRAQEAAEPRDAAVYTDHRDLYEDSDFDAVVVAIPPFAHTDQELLAAEHGTDLFIAKPVALSSEKVAEVETVLEEDGIVTQAGHMWRYADVTDRLLELLDGRTVGMVDGQVWVETPETPWWRERDRSGGQIVEQAAHIYDLVRYVAGDVEQVFAAGDHRLDAPVDFEDVSSVTMSHENGAVSHVSNTCAAPDHQYGLQVVAEDARLDIQYLDNSLSGVVDGEEVHYEGDRDGYARQLESFVDACLTNDPSRVRSDYADAAETLRTALAATRSLESGEPEEVR
jgi:predicted dehydrogenase